VCVCVVRVRVCVRRVRLPLMRVDSGWGGRFTDRRHTRACARKRDETPDEKARSYWVCTRGGGGGFDVDDC
jgi:hypothetical protein